MGRPSITVLAPTKRCLWCKTPLAPGQQFQLGAPCPACHKTPLVLETIPEPAR